MKNEEFATALKGGWMDTLLNRRDDKCGKLLCAAFFILHSSFFIFIYSSFFIFYSSFLISCSSKPENAVKSDALPAIWPDYVGVTIPAGIAPLCFNFADESIELMDVEVRGQKGGQLHVSGDWADFDIDDWRELTEQNRGADLTVSVCTRKDGQWTQWRDFTIHVSAHPLDDYGLTYRRIAPGYEVGGYIGIYERDLHSFTERALLTEDDLPGRCFNCHTPNRTNPAQLTLQIRGEGGGTMVQQQGSQRWLNTKTDSTKAAGSYAYWHPEGRYCAYAVNSVHQAFFTGPDDRIEAYHTFSDVMVLDTQTDELLLSPLLQTDDLEIFPAFSPDGRWLYYSTSRPCRVPAEYERVKCSICRVEFLGADGANGAFGLQADTLVNADTLGLSATQARPSYDGRWLMYTVSQRSNFPVFQRDADLWLMDLQTLAARPLDEVNSPDTESFHNWSQDSRWFVFTSKRSDGMYAQLFLSSIDDQGRCTKPFLLPQRNPRKYYRELFYSFNVPDFTSQPVSFDVDEAQRQVESNQRVQVRVRSDK